MPLSVVMQVLADRLHSCSQVAAGQPMPPPLPPQGVQQTPFNLPPAANLQQQPYYASMDPSQAGTHFPVPGDLAKRPAMGGPASAEPKRARTAMPPPVRPPLPAASLAGPSTVPQGQWQSVPQPPPAMQPVS